MSTSTTRSLGGGTKSSRGSLNTGGAGSGDDSVGGTGLDDSNDTDDQSIN